MSDINKQENKLFNISCNYVFLEGVHASDYASALEKAKAKYPNRDIQVDFVVNIHHL